MNPFSVVIPAYNEERGIALVINAIRAGTRIARSLLWTTGRPTVRRARQKAPARSSSAIRRMAGTGEA